VVQRLGDSENLIGDLLRVIMNLEKAKQTAETRLHNRLKRPENENVKDNAQLRYFALHFLGLWLYYKKIFIFHFPRFYTWLKYTKLLHIYRFSFKY